MNKEEIFEVIKRALVCVLEHENFQLNEKTTAHDIDGWESVTHMMIISEIENELGIKFKLMDLMNMNNVGDLVVMIKSEFN